MDALHCSQGVLVQSCSGLHCNWLCVYIILYYITNANDPLGGRSTWYKFGVAFFFNVFSFDFWKLREKYERRCFRTFPVMLGGSWRMQQHFWYWEIHPAKLFSRMIHLILQYIWVYDSLRHLKFGTHNPVMYWKSILASQAGNKHSWPVTSFTKQYSFNRSTHAHTHTHIYI